MNLERIAAAALLHDIAKKQKHHAEAGADILREMGYPDVAEIAGAHVHIRICDEEPVSEKEVVHLADKLVQEDRIVPLETRFNEKIARYWHNPGAMAAISSRLSIAVKIRQRIENIIKMPVEGAICKYTSA